MVKVMKDSGVEWIGEIPEHWNMIKLSYLFKTIGSGTTPKSDFTKYYDEGTINWLNTGDLNNGNIVETKKKITSFAIEKHSALKIYPENSLIIAMYGATIGQVGITKVLTATNQACCVLANPINTDTKFLFYWLIGNKKNIITLANGGGQPNISQEVVRNLKISIPDLHEQQKLAIFLDGKIAHIDSIIEKTKQSIEEFKKYKQVLITETVTKGLNRDAKMKDSRVEWIGKIPKKWEITKFKYIMKKEKKLCKNYTNEDVLSLTKSGVIVRDLENPSGKMPATFDGYQYVRKGELLLCLFDIDVTPRCVGIVKNNGITSPAYSRYQLKKRNSLRYYNYFLTSLDDRKTLLSFTKSLRNTLTDEAFGAIKTISPPFVEQEQMADYLDEKMFHIDSLIKNKEKMIRQLEEYKNSLIYDYVTGKREVE